MARFFKSRETIIGNAPGTLTFIGSKIMGKTRIRLISYSEHDFFEYEANTFAELKEKLELPYKHWLNIDGLHDSSLVEEVGNYAGLSPLVMEDIVNTDQRPRFVDETEKIVVFLKQLDYLKETKSTMAEQITLVLGENMVITFQEKVGKYFESIRERMRQNIGKLRMLGADYLFYRIIDTIADNYMLCIGQLGEEIEMNESKILSTSSKEFINEIYRHKIEISFMRKAVRPAKEVTKLLKNTETDLINESTWPFFNDLDDLLTHTLETVELYYTMTSDQLNIYNANVSNRANEVMKVLTVFAAIFIPLTFIAGVYGTNFDYLPELHYKYSYFIMLSAMLIVAIIMLLYFRKKRWL